MDILTLMTNNNCDILRKTSSPEFRVPPINLDDLPKFLLGKLRLFIYWVVLHPTANESHHQSVLTLNHHFFLFLCLYSNDSKMRWLS